MATITEQLAALRSQHRSVRLESDVAIPPEQPNTAFVIAKLTIDGHRYSGIIGFTFTSGEELVENVESATERAEQAALDRFGAAALPDPLPVVSKVGLTSIFKPVSPALRTDVADVKCAECGGEITDYFGASVHLSAQKVVEMTVARHERALCAPCSGREAASRVRKTGK